METLSIPAGMTEKEYFETAASEADFLKWYKEQDLPTYETPSVTADMVAYCFVDGQLKLLAIRRKAHPYQHRLALVGGFVNKDEDATHACIREVKEEVGLDLPVNKVEQLLVEPVSQASANQRAGRCGLCRGRHLHSALR